jgi:hypothetical protein
MKFPKSKKQYEAEIDQLKATIEGIIVGVNPFAQRDYQDRDNELEQIALAYGIAIGQKLYEDIEKHLDHCIKNNVSNSTYIDTLP